MSRLFIIAPLFLLAGCPDPLAAPNADFFECQPGNTLVICPIGQTPSPPQECRNVGSGTTTLPFGACS